QLREWSEERELDWDILGDERHLNIKKAFGRLLTLYRTIPAFYELDDEPAGFEWLDADDSERCTFGFVRHARQSGESLVCIFNFTEKEYDGFRTGVPVNADYQLIFDTDDKEYGGKGRKRMGAAYPAERVSVKKWDYSISFGLGAYEGLIFRYKF
ncbi:MAG: alpha amylase C-terminal domain-containing protein, partial [Anaeroplasma sp.]|nr:alpha amylase C-terminal domain-containing protein [Anaeroplasma sp.]